LRCGEIMALEWDHIDLNKRQLCVRRSDWKGQVTAPKSGSHRFVPLTTRLARQPFGRVDIFVPGECSIRMTVHR